MKRIAAGVLVLGALIFLFQNCGQAGFENQEFSDSLSSAQDMDPQFKNLPFPYEISVNQIAHMSCPISKANPGAQSPYFSWKIGAFENPSDVPSAALNIRPAGLQLTSQFQTEWRKVASGFNPSIQAAKLKEFLTQHPIVANHSLQLSFRSTSSPATTLMTLPNGSLAPSAMFLQPVSSPLMAENFLDLPTGPLNIFANAPDFSSRFLETSLIVPSTYGVPDLALRANYDASYMALGFVNTSGDTAGVALAASGSDARYAFGKGYRIHFGKANPHVGTLEYPTSDSLAIVEEQDLQTGYNTPGVAWDCSYRFKIVRNADRFKNVYLKNHFTKTSSGGQLVCPTATVTSDYCASPIDPAFGIHPSKFPNSLCPANRKLFLNTPHCDENYAFACPPEPYVENPNSPHVIERGDGVYHSGHPVRPAILHALRRFLPANQWDINVSRRCIVPKFDDNTCYQNPPIVYDEQFFPGAAANPNIGQYAGCGVNGQYQCAAYLTLCVRR